MATYGNNRNRPNRNQRERSRTRGTLGMLFNPAVGASFSALKETGRMFIHLIALIFAQANLIDKRHPAVVGGGREKYNLFDIIALAYERVEWRQENIGQISMFLAVCAALGVIALGFVYALFSALFAATLR